MPTTFPPATCEVCGGELVTRESAPPISSILAPGTWAWTHTERCEARARHLGGRVIRYEYIRGRYRRAPSSAQPAA